MAKKITVVISQAQGKHPIRRGLEENLAAALLLEPGVEVSLVPHLYDLTPDHTGMLFLKSITGPMILAAWMYPRAARWILDRNGVKGQEGITQLKSSDANDDEDRDSELDADPAAGRRSVTDDSAAEGAEPSASQALGAWDTPQRKIYCLDLRDHADFGVYLEEIRRIVKSASMQTVELMSWIQGSPRPEQLARYLAPQASPGLPVVPGEPSTTSGAALVSEPTQTHELVGGLADASPAAAADESVRRRWYPVIDYSRCTNCMECIDFCLFGVYGLDAGERILVEQQDNCKKGCPACSRVCPENAIIFPEHKTPAIAGADVEREPGGLKIDLSKLFGAPTALDLAVLERDRELVSDGRDAVGTTVGLPRRQSSQPKSRDALDDLMDALDGVEL